MMQQEQLSEEFLSVNPKGKVPALQIGGTVLTENVAILTYLNQQFPDAGLMPVSDGPAETAQQLADLCYCAATLHPIVTRIRNPHFFVDADSAITRVREKASAAMRPNFDLIESRMSNGSWWYGESWSAVDAYLYWIWFRSKEANFSRSEYPHIWDFADRMIGLDPVKRMLAREAAAEDELRREDL